jgi:predicted DNA-binding transcriptional regulator YafY
MLTDDEAIAVVLGLVAGRREGLVTAQGGAGESALAKVRRVLPAALARRLDSLLSTVDFTAREREPAPPGSEVLLVLAEAARRRVPVSLAYTSWRGGVGERALAPYGLVFHAGRWYVTGHDSASGEVRTFRLDRIGSAELSGEPDGSFEVPADFDPTARVLAGLGAVPYAHEVSVVLDVALAEARRRIPPTAGSLLEVPDGAGVRLTMRAERLDGAAQFLAGLGWPFVIERPEELRTAVRDLAAWLVEAAATRH